MRVVYHSPSIMYNKANQRVTLPLGISRVAISVTDMVLTPKDLIFLIFF